MMMTMVRLLVSLLTLLTSASAGGIPADTQFGRAMLSKAQRLDVRRLDQNNNDNNNYYYDAEGNYNENWVAGMSIKFQGCHQISQWNENAESEDDVRIATKRLVRFRLCPSGSCDSRSNNGCNSGYGDYVLDMNTYLTYYFAAKQVYQAFQCDYLSKYACSCSNNANEEKCLYYCFKQHDMEQACMGSSVSFDDDKGYYEANFNLEDYMECTKTDYTDADGEAIYVGPYCSSQGGGILLGAFTDEDCTDFADTSTGGLSAYTTAAGVNLPYGTSSLVDMDCISCKEPAQNNNDGNDASDTDDVSEECENIYMLAGKCESHLASGTVQTPNNNACNYMEGIKIVRKDGTVVTADAKANKSASVFIGLFVVAFVMLSAYVYYLKTKLDRASINLAE